MAYPRYSFQHSVLFIDQTTQTEAMIRQGLLSYPVHFEFCENRLSEALEKIETTRPDLIVSSLDFKEGSVLDLAKTLHHKPVKTPTIYLVDPTVSEMQQQVIKEGGVFDWVARGSDFSELLRKMNHAVMVSREFRKTRSESFIELHEESKATGLPVNELLLKKGPKAD